MIMVFALGDFGFCKGGVTKILDMCVIRKMLSMQEGITVTKIFGVGVFIWKSALALEKFLGNFWTSRFWKLLVYAKGEVKAIHHNFCLTVP